MDLILTVQPAKSVTAPNFAAEVQSKVSS